MTPYESGGDSLSGIEYRCHDVDADSALLTELPESVDGAASTFPKGEIRADDDVLCVRPPNQHVFEEFFRTLSGKASIELLHDDAIDPVLEEDLLAAKDGCKAPGRRIGPKELLGMWVEEEHGALVAGRGGELACATRQGAVSKVHSIEVSDGDSGVRSLQGGDCSDWGAEGRVEPPWGAYLTLDGSVRRVK